MLATQLRCMSALACLLVVETWLSARQGRASAEDCSMRRNDADAVTQLRAAWLRVQLSGGVHVVPFELFDLPVTFSGEQVGCSARCVCVDPKPTSAMLRDRKPGGSVLWA